LGKNLEIQTTILRALNSQYVDTVKLDRLVTIGLNSMLASLDPYTIFIPEESGEDLEMMTTGAYGGVGAIIQKLPSGGILISQIYENTPAVKYNLEPGDTIIAIDTVSTFNKSVSECSALMRGRPGSKVPMKIIKGRSGETVVVDLVRERIHVNDVVYSGFVNDTTGYILIGGFTLKGSEDVKKAFLDMKEQGNLKQLILDLRGNGGGLMSEAVDILSLFVPKGTLVVSAKGKHPDANFEYRTQNNPIDTEIPLMVMVDGGSASSSEIVAGAIQDLDRGVIAGQRTFGKGLVQSIRPTGYNTSLKLTTAKYYTPSGRCVQAIDYSNKNNDGSAKPLPDSLRNEFRTASGRIVYDGGGISPDFELAQNTYSRPVIALSYSNILNQFAIEYYKTHPQISAPGEFALSDEEYEEFVDFAAEQDFDARSQAYIQMEDVLKQAQNEGLLENNPELEGELKSALESLGKTKREVLTENKEIIKLLLEDEIAIKYYFVRGGACSSLRGDKELDQALRMWTENDILN
jgi:carboxyl-terminal processing protease